MWRPWLGDSNLWPSCSQQRSNNASYCTTTLPNYPTINRDQNHFLYWGCKHVYYCCKIVEFNMQVYGDWLTFGDSFKWPLEELPGLGFSFQPRRFPLDVHPWVRQLIRLLIQSLVLCVLLFPASIRWYYSRQQMKVGQTGLFASVKGTAAPRLPKDILLLL